VKNSVFNLSRNSISNYRNLLKDTMNDLKNKTQKEIRKVGASRKSQSANLQ
jgi:hypothetical protein